MGQRTQLLVIEKKPNNVTEKRLYFNMWGQGKRMYNAMTSILVSILDGVSPSGEYNLAQLKDVELKNIPSFHPYFWDYETRTWSFSPRNKEDLQKEIEEADIDNFPSIKALFEQLDNNDGGLVIEVKWVKGKDGDDDVRIKAGFLVSFEENEWFVKFVSPEHYREVEGADYFDDNFFNSFLSLCKFANVEWMK